MTITADDILVGGNAASAAGANTIPVERIAAADWPARAQKLSATHRNWAQANAFEAKPGSILPLPSSTGIGRVLVGVKNPSTQHANPWLWARIASQLPAGRYKISGRMPAVQMRVAAYGWACAHYAFTRYLNPAPAPVLRHLIVEDEALRAQVIEDVKAAWLVRDLVNTPAEDMKPSDIESAARALAAEFSAEAAAIVGDDLLERGFPAIHAVGRAADDAPRLIELRWGKADHPKLTLVGKGVSFDSGGLNIKPGNSMALMKKDMGGAAHALGLARRIMAAELPVQLRVLIPAVENAISGNAFRPGDILPSRKGITIEIGNTDAEGRLILCDALAWADEDKPDMILDFATLTGAARVALGSDLAPIFTTDDAFARDVQAAGTRAGDPVWRMPLYAPYADLLSSPIADTNNISDGGFAGAITAALFLQKFVTDCASWSHFDVYAWSPSNRPGRAKGGMDFAIRAIFDVLTQRFSE